MRYLTDSSQMKAIDSYNIEELGIPSLVLMERAAYAVSAEAEQMSSQNGSVLVICGMGNNGADGLAAARMLKLHGRKVKVLLCGKASHSTKEHSIQLAITEKLGIPAVTADSRQEYSIENGFELIIDALFGVGLSRPLNKTFIELTDAIERARISGAKVLAVDIPSGVSASDGQILGAAVKADATVTFGFEKLGLVLYPGAFYCGKKKVADIGFSLPNGMESRMAYTFGPEDLRRLPKRPADGNKGTFGKVLLAAGSKRMSGAAYMSALASYRSGAGLVQIYTVKENVQVLKTMLPEAIVTGFDREHPDMEELADLCRWADALVAGPGFSTESYAEQILHWLLKNVTLPKVLDADALNLIARHCELAGYLDGSAVITPHIGEMSRLTGKTVDEIKKAPIAAALEFREQHGAVCVLKDARTAVVSENGIYISSSGNSGMATGGSGDVLSGILGGLLAAGMNVGDAAEMGVCLHGLAGDAAAERCGMHAMMATDIISCLGAVLKEWT
ncbi:NAD(P)H-hydrate dehydratase [Qiania dongpingensis]|uniref:Bifunctional NAD(P)H-hydrate repair enzyme n=1 Tax=Qiania dongpingensis TaxID=2763669 RepID=A0A7G9G425_9FIRM|nr:NAD(P)H-hydrate dehydratase [Qiania dongpingensis]QNM05557.1 NAD(P)H-hydrate dehydratase [Qiania dongpingensis]